MYKLQRQVFPEVRRFCDVVGLDFAVRGVACLHISSKRLKYICVCRTHSTQKGLKWQTSDRNTGFLMLLILSSLLWCVSVCDIFSLSWQRCVKCLCSVPLSAPLLYEQRLLLVFSPLLLNGVRLLSRRLCGLNSWWCWDDGAHRLCCCFTVLAVIHLTLLAGYRQVLKKTIKLKVFVCCWKLTLNYLFEFTFSPETKIEVLVLISWFKPTLVSVSPGRRFAWVLRCHSAACDPN